ncbi:MAG TPA: hypothetical protein VNI84_17315 [Pyrinomonadaceae bacterium]|nr:hypothetical protein [Pyrinomonadaceae bacterium]
MSENKQIPRVPVVDDEILQRKIVTRQLARLGFVSEAVGNAARRSQFAVGGRRRTRRRASSYTTRPGIS